MGVGDLRVSGTYGCRGHEGVGDMWVWGTCECGGHVGVGDMRVSGTCGLPGTCVPDSNMYYELISKLTTKFCTYSLRCANAGRNFQHMRLPWGKVILLHLYAKL